MSLGPADAALGDHKRALLRVHGRDAWAVDCAPESAADARGGRTVGLPATPAPANERCGHRRQPRDRVTARSPEPRRSPRSRGGSLGHDHRPAGARTDPPRAARSCGKLGCPDQVSPTGQPSTAAQNRVLVLACSGGMSMITCTQSAAGQSTGGPVRGPPTVWRVRVLASTRAAISASGSSCWSAVVMSSV